MKRQWNRTHTRAFRTVLDMLVKQHPEYEITALLRNAPVNFATIYPNVEVVRGDYDGWEVIVHAASEAHVVVRKFRSHDTRLGSRSSAWIYSVLTHPKIIVLA